MSIDISVIVPLLNEDESLTELASWITRVMSAGRYSYEIIFVDDGSTDRSWEVIESLHAENDCIKGIRFQRNYGKSAALNEGFKSCTGRVVITMDADLQDSPDEIPELYEMITKGGFDLVSGWKKVRHDPMSKTLPSRFFNWVTSKVSKIELHDFNCGLKAYRGNVVKGIEVYGEMHRYIPLIAKWSGFKKIGEKVVQHHARKYGVSKFGVGRLITGGLDLASILFVGKYGKRPMHLFGSLGSICFVFGSVVLFYLTISKFFFDKTGLTQRPLFFVALMAIVVGTQLFVSGFIAELISRNSLSRNNYLIQKKAGL